MVKIGYVRTTDFKNKLGRAFPRCAVDCISKLTTFQKHFVGCETWYLKAHCMVRNPRENIQEALLCTTSLQSIGTSLFPSLLVVKKSIRVVVYFSYIFTRYMLFGTYQAVEILSLLFHLALRSKTKIFREGGRNQLLCLWFLFFVAFSSDPVTWNQRKVIWSRLLMERTKSWTSHHSLYHR